MITDPNTRDIVDRHLTPVVQAAAAATLEDIQGRTQKSFYATGRAMRSYTNRDTNPRSKGSPSVAPKTAAEKLMPGLNTPDGFEADVTSPLNYPNLARHRGTAGEALRSGTENFENYLRQAGLAPALDDVMEEIWRDFAAKHKN